MLTSELLNAHRDVLKEEGITVGLLQKVEKLKAEGKDATLRSLGSKLTWTMRQRFSKVGRWSWSWSDFVKSQRRERLC